jgi:signal transduction histidine kinase
MRRTVNTAQQLVSQLNPQALKQAHDMCAFMHESDIGMAVYNEDFVLLASNPAFRACYELEPGTATSGTPLLSIAWAMHRNEDGGFDTLRKRVDADIERLRKNGQLKFNAKNARGDQIKISRFIKPSGLVVETVERLDVIHEPSVDAAEKSSASYNLEHQKLMTALDNMSDGLAIYDPNGIMVAVNQRCLEFQSYIADELFVGARHEDIIRAVFKSGKVATGRMTEDDFVEYAQRELQAPTSETLDQMNDGRWLRFSGRKLDDGSTVFMQSDVTELVKAQEEQTRIANKRAEENERNEFAFENMYAGLAMFDEDEKLIFCNSNYQTMLKLDKEDVKEGTLREDIINCAIKKGTFSQQHKEQTLKTYKDSVGSDELKRLKYYMSDGSVYVSRYRPLPGGGAIVLALEVTKEERAMELAAKSNRKLKRSNEELQNFAYVASHDLQEPLRKIEAFGDRLLKKYNDLLPEDGQMYMDRIQNASGRMRQLINDLLTFSRVTSNAKEFESVDLNEVLNGVESDIEMRLADNNGSIESEKLPTIDADPLQMRQLFQNLLSNSLKFAKEGVAPVVTISHKVIDRHMGADNLLELRFADNGIGFNNRYKDQIFAIFQRLHGRLEYEGTGIGLSTCRKIIERHNGMIDADGKEGEGATFIVQLPFKQSADLDD